MKPTIYEFNVPDFVVEEGYTIIQVVGGEATIDADNLSQVNLAKKWGGTQKPQTKAKAKKTTVAATAKAEKEE